MTSVFQPDINTWRKNTLKAYDNSPKYNGVNSTSHVCPYAVSRGSLTGSKKISGKLIRDLALDLLNQAYETEPNENSFDNSRLLEMAIATFYGRQILNQGIMSDGQSEDLNYEQIFDRINEDDTPIRDLYINQIVRVALHLSQRTYSGFYSLLFNQVARNIKGQVGTDFIQSLPLWSSEDFFPELYKNETLTALEKAGLKQRHMREYSALLNAFRTASQNGKERVQFFRQCEESNLEDAHMDDLYSQCYNQICIQERFRATQSLQDANKATYSSPMHHHIIVDDAPEGIMLWTYCLPTKDLLIAVAKDQKNPLTDVPFSSSTLERVQRNFSMELKLIQYALSKADIPYSLNDVQMALIYSS